ncbi:MAG TPA: PIG-L family deacetylase [Tepidisphaeraceae bacterium]
MASIVVVGPHPDDQELGMGGTIALLVAQGHRVHLIDATTGEPTPFGSEETRALEKSKAARILGVARTLVGLTNREVVHDIPSRHKMAAVFRQHKPDWIFVPHPTDAHPDHVAVTKIVEDARFDAKLTKSSIPGDPCYPKRIIYYFATHLRMNFQPTFCIDISAQIETKMNAVDAYHSQFAGNPGGAHVPEMVRTINGYFGSRIGVQYAEPFFTHEQLGLRGLSELV